MEQRPGGGERQDTIGLDLHGLGLASHLQPVLRHEHIVTPILEPPAYVSLADWNRCAPFIEGALRYGHGTHNLADVLEDILQNRATLWPFEKSAVVTQITRWPRLTSLTFWLAGGNMRELLSKEPGIVEWGRQHGCTHFVVMGRPGWQRAMKPLGYRPHNYSTFKEVSDG